MENVFNAEQLLVEFEQGQLLGNGEGKYFGTDVVLRGRNQLPALLREFAHLGDVLDGAQRLFVGFALHFDGDDVLSAELLLQLSDRRIGNEFAFIDNHGAVANGFYLAEDVGGEDDGFFATEVADQLTDFDNLIGVEAGSGFVEN